MLLLEKLICSSLLQLLVTGIGYGYYMVHKKGKKVEYYKCLEEG